ncbi:MAG: hypothetical protein V4685_16400 [Bacteroidota bacterium]
MFSYNVQLAGYSFDKFDEKGKVEYDKFVTVFDSFPWLEQLDEANLLKEGCSATLSVKASDDNKDFWVSIAGDRQKTIFLVGYVYFKEKKTFFGLGKLKMVRWVDIYEAEDSIQIKYLFGLFFNKKFFELEAELKRLKDFDSMEAYS